MAARQNLLPTGRNRLYLRCGVLYSEINALSFENGGKRYDMIARKTLPRQQSPPSRRDVLQIFAAGMAGAVGTIALDRAPLLNPAGASDGGTLRIAWLTPAQLDPRSVAGMSEIAILNALYDYLFETDAASNLVPTLASSWERNDDGTRYTLHLVENALFHDGSPLTARDVVWSIQWQLDAGGTIADLLAGINSVEAAGDHTSGNRSQSLRPRFSLSTHRVQSRHAQSGTRRMSALNSTARVPLSWKR